MKRNAIPLVQPLAFLVAICASLVNADGSDLSWHTMDGGGEMWSVGGNFELGGTIGQPDAGTLAGDGFTVLGGFWVGAPPPGAIPTVSQWGMVGMTLLVLAAGTVVFRRIRRASPVSLAR